MEQDNKKQQIQREVDATLKAFESSSALPHDPWFYDKLKRRIKQSEQATSASTTGWYGRALKPVLLATLVALNIVALIWIMESTATGLSPRTTYINNLADEYGLNIADTYLLDNNGNGNGNGGEH